MSDIDEILERVERRFAAPDFREHQKEAIAKIVHGIENLDKDVMVLKAPTGAGKSLILDGASEALDEKFQEETDDGMTMAGMMGMGEDSDIPEPLGEGTFFTTPLNALVDQVDEDEFISPRAITLKGRNNYECIHPKDSGTRVDEAICQRESDFECDVKNECPYYGRKYEALQHRKVVTSMSYLMAEGMIPGAVKGTFANRDILIVDECQKIEDFAMNFISFTVSRRTVPDEVWSNINIPDAYTEDWADEDEDVEEDMEFLTGWLEDEVLGATVDMITYLEGQAMMSKNESKDLENLKQFKMRVENFIQDVRHNDWIAQIDWDINKNRSNDQKIIFKPVEIGRFLENLLWSRADHIILSSATVPTGDWYSEIGLGDKDIGTVTVPSTFPVENRPIILDEAVGKMTSSQREENAWPMAQKIKKIAEYHDGKGMVHCRAYSIAELLKRSFQNHGEGKWFRENVMVQDRQRREESLEEWQKSDKQVFFSVAMDEGISLDDDKCRWQVLAKALFKSLGDKRVRYRLYERGDNQWYNRHAAIQIAQAYGRAVRSKEDWAYFYVLDTSAANLIRDSPELFPDWFLDAVED